MGGQSSKKDDSSRTASRKSFHSSTGPPTIPSSSSSTTNTNKSQQGVSASSTNNIQNDSTPNLPPDIKPVSETISNNNNNNNNSNTPLSSSTLINDNKASSPTVNSTTSASNIPNPVSATNIPNTTNHQISIKTQSETATPDQQLSPSSQYLSGRLPSNIEKDLDDIIRRLLEQRNHKLKTNFLNIIKNNEIIFICHKAREIFLDQPMLLELSPPVNIVGDIHGQYDDLLRIFDMTGSPPASNYLFLGDYVDRGKQSLETILLLLCYKIKFPENFFVLRGNHECASVNRVYGFYDECKRRTNLKIWKVFTDVFNCMPLAAVVAGKIFCVHGGLSPSLNSMDDIRSVARPTDVPDFGLVNDLVWSDPSEIAAEWEDNERGVSYCFGKAIVTDFLAKHDFDLVCRAHMVVEEGYEFFNDRTLVTIFSAPNYCGEFDNKGGVMAVNDDLLCAFEILQPINVVKPKSKTGSIRTVN